MRERSATAQYYVGNTYVEAPGLKPYRRMPPRRRDISPPPVKREYTLPDISKWGATFEAMEPLRRARDRKESLRRRMFGHHKHEVAENEDPESEARVLCVDSIVGDISPELHSKIPLKALSEGMVELDLGSGLVSPKSELLSPVSTESVPDNSLTAALRKMAAGNRPISPVLPSPARAFGSRSLSLKDAQFAREVTCSSPAPQSECGDVVPLYKRRSNSVNPTPMALKYMNFKHERSKSVASIPCSASSHNRNRSLTSIVLSPLSVPEIDSEGHSDSEKTVECPCDDDAHQHGNSDGESECGSEASADEQWVPPNLTSLGASGRSMGDMRGFAATGVVASCLPRLPLLTGEDMMESGTDIRPVLRKRNRRSTPSVLLPVGPASNFSSSLDILTGADVDESEETARTMKSVAFMAPPTTLFGYTADGHISVDQIKGVRVCLSGSMIGPIDITAETSISSSTGSLRRIATGTQIILCGPLSGNDISTYTPVMTFMALSSDLDPLTPIQRLACKSEEYKPLSIAKNQPPTGESGKGTRGAGVSEKAFKATCKRRLGENVLMTAEMTVKSTKNFRGGRGLQEIVDIKLLFESRWVYQGDIDDSIISNMDFVTATNAFLTRGA